MTVWSLVISGACALTAGFFFAQPALLTALCLLWGFTVVADSAQFSAAVSELTLFSLRLIPPLQDLLGWEYVFTILAIGPVFGIASMLRLRSMPDAERMACGRR